MTHRVPEDQYKAIMRRNGARGGTVSAERKAALARATETASTEDCEIRKETCYGKET